MVKNTDEFSHFIAKTFFLRHTVRWNDEEYDLDYKKQNKTKNAEFDRTCKEDYFRIFLASSG